LVGEPDGCRSLLSLQANFGQDNRKIGLGVLFGVQPAPSAETNLPPTLIDEGHIFLRLVPALWFFESEAASMLAGPTAAPIGWRWAIQHPVTTQTDHFGTGHILHAAQETMVAVLAIGYDDIQSIQVSLGRSSLAERFNLNHR
jgi:hypothetical protein